MRILDAISAMWSAYRVARSGHRALELLADGLRLYDASTQMTIWRLRWDDVTEIVAFKVDQFAVDDICLGFRTSGLAWSVVDEETQGWTALNEELKVRFSIAFESWFQKVAFPAFKRNWTVLWTRSTT